MSSNMAVSSTFLLLVFNFYLLPSALSRLSSESSHTTNVFNVSASTKQAQNALSFRPQNLNYSVQSPEKIKIPTNSSFFSLPLHPRLALQNSPYKDYETLVKSRLARDAARVKSLNDRLNFALNGESEFRPEDLSVPVISGLSQGSGEYFARIGIGQPVQQFYLVPDTGSDVNWLQCEPCTSCFTQIDPKFNPSSSSSYNSLSCDSEKCQDLRRSNCVDGTCSYQVSYGDGSFTAGEFATETLTLGDSDPIPNVAIGCGHDNEGLFYAAAGIFGLGGGPLSLSSQIGATSFSYCLVDRDSDSSSTLDFNSVQLSGSIISPLLKNEKFNAYRYIKVTGLSVGGQPLSISPDSFQIDDESGYGGVIVDSGTIITRLQTQIYESLRDAFVSLTQQLPRAPGVSLFDTCYDLSSQPEVRVPTVAIQLSEGNSLRLPAKNYLIRVDSAGTFCFAFAATRSPLSIIGSFQQQGMRVGYDLANSAVGFAANQC